MESQMLTLLQHHYNIVPKKIQQVRSVYKVVSDQGEFAVKMSKATPEQMVFLQQRLLYFRQLGFDGAIPYVITRDGFPFISVNERVLYVVPWVKGTTGRTMMDGADQRTSVFAQLGQMHRLGSSHYKDNINLYDEVHRLLEQWNERIYRLMEYHERASGKAYPSPTDVVFMANVDELKDMAVEATGRLEEWLQRLEDDNKIRLTFCHGRLSLDHIILSEKPIFINFDRANMDVPARDLSYFLRTLSSQRGDRMRVEEWMNVYMRENPLTKEEVEILSISLQYPIAIFHFLERYYNEQYAGRWTELTLVRRFEKLIDEQQLLLYI